MALLQVLQHAGSFSVALPIAAGFYSYKNHTAGFRILLLVFIASVLSDQYSYYLITQKQSYLWVYNLYTLCEGSLLIYTIATWIKVNNHSNMLRAYAVTAFVVIWIASTAISNGLFNYNRPAPIAEGFILIFLSGWFLYSLSNTTRHNILVHPKFYMAAGILIYFTGNTMYFGLLDYLNTIGYNPGKTVYLIHPALSIVCNILYFAGYIFKTRRPL